ncbi:hypothetical protein [Erythrobacter sp. F6033]|uniref:hypothetical protein n=1 Tax=Erythrobacter sp. F6033 TaxID=2926401 RepID=UPI001FF4C553|nr:hypothetical protein [Erythrobacter sp. F6033]MCK0129689.1 hypothetical protein [Erythrobacter sp. F6033]
MNQSKGLCTVALIVSALAVAGCQPHPSPQTAGSGSPPSLIAGVCGDCHGVEAPFISPNPEAPGFDAIANREGLNEKTMNSWLLNAHNYPLQMEFELSEGEAKQIADYMLTLQSDDYEPEQ